LNAIRIVLSFGQQEREIINYQKHLLNVKKTAMNTHLKNALGVAFFLSSVFGVYAYSFFMGTVFIYHDVYNSLTDKGYTAGNVMTCFFGVVFGMFALGLGSPNIKAIAEGRAAGKSAFEVIDRQTAIDSNDPKAKRVKDI
jgi:hypothetical protein